MESQGNLREAVGANPGGVPIVISPLAGTSISAQRPPIPPTPFFHGFHGAGSQMPFLYPHSYMPPLGFGFGPPVQSTPTATIDLTEGSPKRVPYESVIDHSQPNKKRRAPRKKPEIVVLDDNKEDVELMKNGHHWKDHWTIQLISLRGEMQNTFNAPPKQGMPLSFFHGFISFSSIFSFFFFWCLVYARLFNSIHFSCFHVTATTSILTLPLPSLNCILCLCSVFCNYYL